MLNRNFLITLFGIWYWFLPGTELDDGTLPLPHDKDSPQQEQQDVGH